MPIMGFFRAQFLQSLLFCGLLILLICSTQALEKNGSLKKLKFKLNKKFLLNKKACRIPTLQTTLDDLLSSSRLEIPINANYLQWKRWLRDLTTREKNDAESNDREERSLKLQSRKVRKAQKTESKRMRGKRQRRSEWRIAYQKKHQALLEAGEGWSVCIILDQEQRRLCCEGIVKYKGPTNERSQFKLDLCMTLVMQYANLLMDTGVMLKESDEKELDDKLHRILSKMRKDKGTDTSVKSSLSVATSLTPGNDEIRQAARTPDEENDKQKVFVAFLASMKIIEQMILHEDSTGLDEKYRKIYFRFLKAFEACYEKEKTAVFYHAVKGRWMTCGPLKMGEQIAVYCADLAAVNPKSLELTRKPILKWESGASKPMREYLDGKTTTVRSAISVRSDDDITPVVRAEEKFVVVELFGDSCDTAKLAYTCNAGCCETVYRYSYTCQTDGLTCVG